MIPAVLVEPQKRIVSFTAYWRNDRVLMREFGAPLINLDYNYWLKYQNEPIRNIIVTYAAGWMDWREICTFFRRHPESTWWRILNEYKVTAISADVGRLRKEMQKEWHFIANFGQTLKKGVASWFMTNLSSLAFHAETDPPKIEKKFDILYYGMFRPDREIYFKRYFDSDIHVSTSPKNILLFKNIKVYPKFIDTFLWGKRSLIENFRYLLYLEDVFTHSHYNYPSSRFYEGLTYNVVQIFDQNCRGTFEKAGYDILPFVVKDRDSLRAKIKEINSDYPHFLAMQKRWRKKAAADRAKTLEELGFLFK